MEENAAAAQKERRVTTKLVRRRGGTMAVGSGGSSRGARKSPEREEVGCPGVQPSILFMFSGSTGPQVTAICLEMSGMGVGQCWVLQVSLDQLGSERKGQSSNCAWEVS